MHENITEKKAVIITKLHGSAKIIPFQFIQIMENLIHNAIKFAREDVPLQIEITSRIGLGSEFQEDKLSPNSNYCHICFCDNGIGFDAQHSEKIFGVFQKLHSKDVYAGTGIGLAIVKKIVENHSGHISATGEPMNGAKFNIYIPHTAA